MSRFLRLLVATVSLLVIAAVGRSTPAQALDGCYACGCASVICHEQCGTYLNGACFEDLYDFCAGSEWGGGLIAPCA